jgi:3-hydroxybutyryl-CoA dehydrogenase
MNTQKIAVLGAGTMGPGIAATYAANGYEVSVYSRSNDTLQRARSVVDSNLELLCREGLTGNAAYPVRYTTDLEEAVRDAWYIVETIVEKPDAKIALYGRLDEITQEGVIFASNTSALNIFELVPARRLSHTVIAHWFAPAHILPLVEVIRGPQTQDDVMDRTVALHAKCGKTPVRMERYIPGFIINRLQGALTREVCMLVEDGYCTPEDLDLAVKISLMPRGMLLGLVQRMDFTGLDMMVNTLNNNTYHPVPPPDKPGLVFDPAERGDLGVKTGKGIYDYTHRPYQQVLRQRDEQLLQSVKLAREFMDHPLHKKED